MAAKTPARKSPARKATPRKAAPRKRAAATKTGDGSNGEAVKAGPSPSGESAAPAANAAVVLEETPDVVNPYDTEAIYVYWPRNGDPAIVFPEARTLVLDREFIWSIYEMSAMVQGFEWMNRADVPRDIQRRVVRLPDDEYEAFWAGWFKTMGVRQSNSQGPPGES